MRVACYPRDGGTLEALEANAVELVAAGDINVVILGETGVGKEVLAQSIHDGSRRAKKPLASLSCAAFSESLLESQLFRHEKGAFTGALQAKVGLIESADGGGPTIPLRLRVRPRWRRRRRGPPSRPTRTGAQPRLLRSRRARRTRLTPRGGSASRAGRSSCGSRSSTCRDRDRAPGKVT